MSPAKMLFPWQFLSLLKTSSPLKAFLVNYTYFAYPIVGLAGIFLGALYGVVTMKMTAYEKERRHR